MAKIKAITTRPTVRFMGDTDQVDFQDAAALLRSDAKLITGPGDGCELVIVAQSRPGSIGAQAVEKIRRESPLAGIIALAGSWCEGETRTGRPWRGVERLYWHEFPAWWRRQLTIRAAGRCPGWLRPESERFNTSLRSEPGCPRPRSPVVTLQTPRRETASTLADVLHRAGYATAWQSNARSSATIRGAAAGIWEGGQLDDNEALDLAKFCRRLSADAAAVVVLLDFPRRDAVDRALEHGATAVLGKPWINAELIESLSTAIERQRFVRAA